MTIPKTDTRRNTSQKGTCFLALPFRATASLTSCRASCCVTATVPDGIAGVGIAWVSIERLSSSSDFCVVI